MVKATRGTLITCDPAVKQIIIQLDEQSKPRFIIQDLDDAHLLIAGNSVETVKESLQIELDKNNFISAET